MLHCSQDTFPIIAGNSPDRSDPWRARIGSSEAKVSSDPGVDLSYRRWADLRFVNGPKHRLIAGSVTLSGVAALIPGPFPLDTELRTSRRFSLPP